MEQMRVQRELQSGDRSYLAALRTDAAKAKPSRPQLIGYRCYFCTDLLCLCPGSILSRSAAWCLEAQLT